MCCSVFIIEPIYEEMSCYYIFTRIYEVEYRELNMLSVFRKLLWQGERVYSDGGAGVAERRQPQLNYELNDTEVLDGQ